MIFQDMIGESKPKSSQAIPSSKVPAASKQIHRSLEVWRHSNTRSHTRNSMLPKISSIRRCPKHLSPTTPCPSAPVWFWCPGWLCRTEISLATATTTETLEATTYIQPSVNQGLFTWCTYVDQTCLLLGF